MVGKTPGDYMDNRICRYWHVAQHEKLLKLLKLVKLSAMIPGVTLNEVNIICPVLENDIAPINIWLVVGPPL